MPASAAGNPPGRLRRGLAAAAGFLVDALLPPHCLTCDAPVQAMGTQCAACFRDLTFCVDPMCQRCGVPMQHAGLAERVDGALLCPGCAARPPAFDTARALYWYQGGAKRLVLAFKYADRAELGRYLARRLAPPGRALLERAELLVPVPLHRRRLLARRYNQAAILARHLARNHGRPWLPDALRRSRATPPLGERGAAERALLVQDAFTVTPRAARRLVGRRVLLIDDVLTSGATAEACARALLAAGASAVDVLAVARTPDRRLVEHLPA